MLLSLTGVPGGVRRSVLSGHAQWAESGLVVYTGTPVSSLTGGATDQVLLSLTGGATDFEMTNEQKDKLLEGMTEVHCRANFLRL